MGRLTKAAIVTRALEIVGPTVLQSTGELWLDLLLDELAHSYRWPELEKEHAASIGDGTETIPYPDDYGFLTPDMTLGHVGTFQPSGSTGRSHLFLGLLGGTRGSSLHTADAKGAPAEVADDRMNSRWVLHPISNVGGTVRLEYQSVPAPVATGVPVWFPSDLALIEAVSTIAEKRQRGNQLTVSLQIKEAAKRLALSAPSRTQMWAAAGQGSGLDRRMFR